MEKIIIFKVLLLPLFMAISSIAAAGTEENYLLDTGDSIRIKVYQEDDLHLESKINDSGTITYPFIGKIKVKGLTLKKLEELITNQLKGDYLINPKVSVDIVEYRPFYVNGEVKNAGGFPYQPGLTVRKAISLAGGFKERASKDDIFVIREGTVANEPAKVTLDSIIQPGDIITVEESFF